MWEYCDIVKLLHRDIATSRNYKLQKPTSMGITRTENYTNEQIDLAQMLKVLGHPARIAIVQSIIRSDKCICGDLVAEIGLAQPTISRHLNELKQAGIIEGSVKGTSVCYCINSERWKELKAVMNELLNAVDVKQFPVSNN